MAMRLDGWTKWMRRVLVWSAAVTAGCQGPDAVPDPAPEPAAEPAPPSTSTGQTPSPEQPTPRPPDVTPEPVPPPVKAPGLDARRPWWRASYYAGVMPGSFGVGDFDGDGAPDVVVHAEGSAGYSNYNPRTQKLRVLRNDGRGGLASASALFDVTGSNGGLVAGDLNADGALDVVLGSGYGSRVFLGQGTGALTDLGNQRRLGELGYSSAGVWRGPSGAPLFWTLGIFRGEWDYQRPRFFMARILADTRFEQWEPLPPSVTLLEASGMWPGGGFRLLGLKAEVADFNEDGLPDVVFSEEQRVEGQPSARVFLGDSAGGLVPGASLAPVEAFLQLSTADFNRDGHTDLLTLSLDARSVGVWLGTGQGTFKPAPTVQLAHAATQVAVVSLDGDGLPDVVALHADRDMASLLHGRGDGSLTPQGWLAVGRRPQAVASTDLDGDGQRELLVLEQDDNAVSVYTPPDVPQWGLVAPVTCPLNPRSGDPAPQAPVAPLLRMPQADIEEAVAGDFDADGRMDLALTRVDQGVRLMLHERDGRFPTRELSTSFVSNLSAGDFDGDGRVDLVGVFQPHPHSSPFVPRVLWNEASGDFSPGEDLTYAWRETFGTLAGDFDGDGRVDLALAPYDSGGDAVRKMSVGGRQFRSSTLGNYSFPSDPDHRVSTELPMATADFDGDGTRDVLHLSTYGVNINLTAKDGTPRGGEGFYLYGDPRVLAAEDADGDGRMDVIFDGYDPRTPVTLMRGDGHGTVLESMDCTLPRGKKLIAWKDVNADGLADAVSLEDNGQGWTLWVMLRAPGGRWGSVRPHLLDSEAAWVVPVDLMGDARPELAVRTGAGTLLVFPPLGP